MRRAVVVLVAALAALATVLAPPAAADATAPAHRAGIASRHDGAASRQDGAASRQDGAASRQDGAASRQDGAASGDDGIAYRPPVDAPLVDVFRAPTRAYGAGNRGIDYATSPGQPVLAAAGGEVVFAGRVGTALHAVVLHPDGIRTTYAFLSALAVRRGDRVEAGQAVGAAGAALHFGARAGEVYLDPMALLGGGRPVVRLVPEEALRVESEAQERRGLEHMLRRIGSALLDASAEALAWARARAEDEVADRLDELRGWLHYAAALGVPLQLRVLVATVVWRAEQQRCTPAAAAPTRPGGRRLAVLVGGLGSATGHAAVLDVDTAGLGYATADVSQFSYRAGGPYGAADTQVGIDTAAALLSEHVRRLQAAHPGVPVDIIAHSQGGLVARAALVSGLDGVATLVTLGTPHQGADLATAAAMVAHSDVGDVVLRGAGEVGIGGVDPTSPSVRQMAETSDFIARLADAPLPSSTRVVSVAARHDLVVPSPRSRLRGAANVVVTVGTGPAAAVDHSRLPGSPAARREIALAVAGLAPTCQTLADHLADVMAGEATAFAEDAAGAALAAGGKRLDGRIGPPAPGPPRRPGRGAGGSRSPAD